LYRDKASTFPADNNSIFISCAGRPGGARKWMEIFQYFNRNKIAVKTFMGINEQLTPPVVLHQYSLTMCQY